MRGHLPTPSHTPSNHNISGFKVKFSARGLGQTWRTTRRQRDTCLATLSWM